MKINLESKFIGISPERQQLYYNGIQLELDHKTLTHYDVKPGSTIHVQDVGELIPRRLGKFIIYLGPILCFYLYSKYLYKVFSFLMGKQEFDMIEGDAVLWVESIV